MSLDSLEFDPSASLTASPKAAVEQQAETTEKIGRAIRRWKLAPTRREQDKWDKATKAATEGSVVMFRELRKPRGNPEVLAAESHEQYYKLWCWTNCVTDLYMDAWKHCGFNGKCIWRINEDRCS